MPHRLGMEAVYFRCRNWHKFQHYPEGSRRLTWIKNWIELDDPSNPFSKLTFAEQGRLQAIWRLAAKLDNKIPWDEQFVARAINAKRVPLGDLLDSKWVQVGSEKELKRLANAEKRAANRIKPASKPLAVREQNACLEVEEDKERTTPSIATPVDNSREEHLGEALAYMDSIEFQGRPRLEALSLGPTLMDEAIRRTRSRGDVGNPAAYFTTVTRNLLAVQRAWKSDMPLEERLLVYVKNAGHEYPDYDLRHELLRKGADGEMVARLLVHANEIREAAA